MDPLSQIEDEKAHNDIGVTSYRVYSGARSVGATRIEATMVVYAWCRAMFAAAAEDDTVEEETE